MPERFENRDLEQICEELRRIANTLEKLRAPQMTVEQGIKNGAWYTFGKDVNMAPVKPIGTDDFAKPTNTPTPSPAPPSTSTPTPKPSPPPPPSGNPAS